MRILLVSSEYPPESPGGLGNSVHNLAAGLRACGAHPHILSSRPCSADGTSTVEEDEGGIPVTRIPRTDKRWRGAPSWFWRFHPYYTPVDRFRYSLRVADACREIIQRKSIDLVQFADYGGEGFAFVGAAHGIPTVVRLATPLYLVDEINRAHVAAGRMPTVRRPAGARALLKILEQKPIREARAVASPSRNLARIIEREAEPKGTVRIIPTGIDLGHFTRRNAADAREAAANCNIGAGRMILCVGRYEYRKGMHDLIDAFARICTRLPQYTLVFAGGDTETAPGGGSMKEYCARRAAEHGISDRIRLLDRVSYEALPGLYSLAALFVAPSLYENLANTVLEAMACGLPVISTTSGGASEIIDDPANGTLVPASDPEALANAILELLDDSDRCTIIGETNARKARLEFSRETMAERFLDLYRLIRR